MKVNLLDKQVKKIGKATARVWDKYLIDCIVGNNIILEKDVEKTFLEYIIIYKGLSNRQWKFKRSIADFIASNAYRFLDIIKAEVEKPTTVHFRKYGELPRKRLIPKDRI